MGLDKVLKVFEIDRIMSEGQIGSTLGALDRLIRGWATLRARTRPA